MLGLFQANYTVPTALNNQYVMFKFQKKVLQLVTFTLAELFYSGSFVLMSLLHAIHYSPFRVIISEQVSLKAEKSCNRGPYGF